MRSIYKDFVKHAEAKDLQALGFDDKCIGTIDQTEYMHLKGTSYPARGAMCYDTVACPTYSQALRWFRDKHHIVAWVVPYNTLGGRRFTFIIEDQNGTDVDQEDTDYDHHEDAELKCLQRVIQIVEHAKHSEAHG
jgi:hypothetical protein